MSPIDFDLLQDKLPQYSGVWPLLRDWFASNSRKQFAELKIFARNVPANLHPELAFAIAAMVDLGYLTPAYRVRAPGGYLLEGEFESVENIPSELPDRDFSSIIRTSESDLVTGFRWKASDAA